MKTLKIGLFGFGHVGKGFYEIAHTLGKGRFSIVKICVKNALKERSAPMHLFTIDPDEILQDRSIDIIVEAIGGSEEAYPVARKALANRKPLITANKKMVAEHLAELLEWQAIYQTPIRYESSVCGAIPILHSIDSYLRAQDIQSIKGIFNGSSNFILTKVFDQGVSYEHALIEAQQLGFAEVDPTLDVGGFDALSKLVILLHQSYGLPVSPKRIPRFGIQSLTDQDVLFSQNKGLKIKPLVSLQKHRSEVRAWVMPSFVTADDPLFLIDQELNAAEVETAFTQKLLFSGKGAGSYPTGSAVYADLLNVSQDINRSLHLFDAQSISYHEEVQATVYVSGKATELADLPIDTLLLTGENHIIGKAHLSKLQAAITDKNVFVCEAGALGLGVPQEITVQTDHTKS